MAVKGFDKLKFCGGGGGGGGGGGDGSLTFKRHNSCERNDTWNSGVRRQVSYDDSDDDDDVSLAVRLSRMPNSGTRSGVCDVPVQKRGDTTTMPIKRPFGNSNALQNSVKKLKVTTDDNPLTVRIKVPGKVADESVSLMKKDLALVEKPFEGCKSKRQVEEKRLLSIKRDIEECSKELVNLKKKNSCVERISGSHKKMLGKIDECVKDSVAKEAQLCLMDDLIGERKRELKRKEIELHQVMDNIVKHREGKEEELKALSEKIAQCTVELKARVKERVAMKKQIDEQAEILKSENKKLLKVMMQLRQMNEFELTKKQFEEQVKELELKEKRCRERVMELESKEKLFEGRVKELEFKEKQLEGQAEEFELKVERFHNQIKELESEKKDFDRWVKELESKERQFEGQVKRLELKEEQLEGRVKELDSKEEDFKGQVKDLESKENKLEARVNEFKSEKEQFQGRLKELRLKEKLLEDKVKKFKGRVEEIESKEDEFKARMHELKRFISRMEDFNSEEEQFEGRGKELVSIDKIFKVHANEFEQKEKQLDRPMKDLELKPNEFDGQHKQPELREKQCVAVIQPFEEETELGNQLSPTIDDRCLMLVPCERTDEFESFDYGLNLQSLSDRSKNVLEIIQNPIFPKCKMGNSDVIIDDRDILLLEELMRISPDVKPHTREKAMELALELKANMEESTENSKVVLGFLLLLSIYGLVPSFDEDEVLKLFELVSQQKIAVVLFGALGFADKISDFVENLIARQQYVEAVRFSCAYNLGDNNQLVALLREHVHNAKLISESSCNKVNSIEIKDKARDQEIASLRAVLQCIEDNNLESEDTHNTIHDRILELKRQTGK
ncbi:unnamed protein product [Vicia faba]|uniref:FRIGIDA-like protein n=1 Tax=Vicia faba TaxID=3906 RepID=A0AAV0Z2P1_VICFA|nr:unnamed protein product [Vicia faba]